MNALVTSDWQAAWSNIEQCQIVQDQMHQLCKDRGVKTILHVGDFKQHYSPVDVRVINYGVQFVESFVQKGIRVVILLGNHDRASMSIDAPNWFPALAAAGAYTIDRPRVRKFPDGTIAAVPYMADPVAIKKAIRRLAKEAPGAVLLFHHEIKGCKLNVAQLSKDTPFAIGDLLPDKFEVCLGGHIHMHQQLHKNVYYVGSPFAQDWGEANQRKGIVHLNGSKVEFIPTAVPGLYDPSMPGFKEAKPSKWAGSSVRVHVAFDKAASTSYKAFIDKAVSAAQEKYKGADITIVPEFLDSAVPDDLGDDGTDESIVQAFIEHTCPAHIKNRKGLVKYIMQRLSEQGAVRKKSQTLRLISGSATNFLSFKELDFRYQSGITVVTGRNKDWPGRNNGSGKTNLLQLPAVAFFGKTLKGQEADRWVRRSATGEPATVTLKFKLADGRVCHIRRQRNPAKLSLTVAGKDHSVGIGVRGTQAAIEALTGMSWESLSNAMYIDQAEVSTILTGTDAERKAIFAKFLNLERFAKARSVCAEAVREALNKVGNVRDEVENIKHSITSTKDTIEDFNAQPVPGARRIMRIAKAKWIALEKEYEALCEKRESARAKLDKAFGVANLGIQQFDKVIAIKEHSLALNEQGLHSINSLKSKGICPECKQQVDKKHLASAAKTFQVNIEALEKSLTKVQQARTALRVQQAAISDRAKELPSTEALKQRLDAAVVRYSVAKAALKEAKHQATVRGKYEKRLKELNASLARVQTSISTLEREVDYQKFCVLAFSKDGIPAFLAAKICPMLNAAAKKYSALFSEDEIQVRFQMQDQDIDVEIINVNGGESLADQSAGETRIAGIITGFAIRDVINPCSVLILDEPSESLDAVNAKVFAEGLRTAASWLGSVLLTTHNPFVLGELESEHLVQVTKHRGISTAKEL